MQEMNIRTLANEVNSTQPPKRKKKKTGRTTTEIGEVPVERNLRSSSRVNATNDDLQTLNDPPEHQPTEETPVQQKKNVRGPSRKADIFARQNKPKLELQINDRGQPCGPSSTEFANFIGALVRTKVFPIAHDDWRKVCPRQKYKLWTDAQLYWQIDQGVFNWFMKTAATKWKEFKSDLKKLYDDDMNDDELMDLCDNRIHEADWKWLIDHWRSPNAASEELGCPPRRDELFIKTHTHKTVVPHQGSQTTINALKDAIRDHPELTEKSIQEGDVYSYVCGPERNGYVRVVGLGPTPAELEMPGSRRYTSTRLQMEMEARKQSDKKVEELSSRLDKLQETMDRWIQMQLSFQNANTTPNGSNNAPKVNSRTRPSHADEEHDDAGSYDGDDMDGMPFCDDDDIMNRRVVLPKEQDDGGGRDVILYNIVRPYDTPVAKATIQTTNPRVIVGGTPLGVQFYEVVVNHVFVRSAILPRPYGALATITNARGRSIAWPRDRMKDDKKPLGRPSQLQGT